jgi:hypothetical protein
MESCSRSQNSHYSPLIRLTSLVKIEVLQSFPHVYAIGLYTYITPHSSNLGDQMGDYFAPYIILVPHS